MHAAVTLRLLPAARAGWWAAVNGGPAATRPLRLLQGLLLDFIDVSNIADDNYVGIQRVLLVRARRSGLTAGSAACHRAPRRGRRPASLSSHGSAPDCCAQDWGPLLNRGNPQATLVTLFMNWVATSPELDTSSESEGGPCCSACAQVCRSRSTFHAILPASEALPRMPTLDLRLRYAPACTMQPACARPSTGPP